MQRESTWKETSSIDCSTDSGTDQVDWRSLFVPLFLLYWPSQSQCEGATDPVSPVVRTVVSGKLIESCVSFCFRSRHTLTESYSHAPDLLEMIRDRQQGKTLPIYIKYGKKFSFFTILQIARRDRG